MKKLKQKQIDPIEQERQYVAFLKNRLESKNYKSNVTVEEYEETENKYEKAKFKLRMMTEGKLK